MLVDGREACPTNSDGRTDESDGRTDESDGHDDNPGVMMMILTLRCSQATPIMAHGALNQLP